METLMLRYFTDFKISIKTIYYFFLMPFVLQPDKIRYLLYFTS